MTSATRAELAGQVRDGSLSTVELVEECVRRIDAARELNAVVALRADEALEDAKAARAHADGPLQGLPLLVKDMARYAGMVTTLGSPLYRDAPPDTVDDIVVARLKA